MASSLDQLAQFLNATLDAQQHRKGTLWSTQTTWNPAMPSHDALGSELTPVALQPKML
jgi:hypothetical protein